MEIHNVYNNRLFNIKINVPPINTKQFLILYQIILYAFNLMVIYCYGKIEQLKRIFNKRYLNKNNLYW